MDKFEKSLLTLWFTVVSFTLIASMVLLANTASAMSHGLTDADRMAYVGNVPWHGLGVDASEHPRMIVDTDGRTLGIPADDMFDLAFGQGFHVSQRPLFELLNSGARLPLDTDANGNAYADDASGWFGGIDGDPILRRLDSHVSQVREDTNGHLGVVSPKFGNLQPRDLLELPAKVVGEAGIGFETAGSLWGGRTIWALANLGSQVIDKLPDGSPDTVNMHVLFKTGFDGKTASVAMLTPIRVVCANTLAFAMHYSRRERAEFTADELADMKAKGLFGRPGQVKWKHRGEQTGKLESATSILLGLNKAIEQEADVFRSLVDMRADLAFARDWADSYLNDTRGQVTADASPTIQRRRDGQRDAIVGYFATSPGCSGRHRWDLFNASAYFEEHSEEGWRQRGARGLSDEQNAERKLAARFESQTDGQVVDRRGAALKLLLSA